MKTISINFVIPNSWSELSDKQLRYVYQLIASEHTADEIKTLFLLKWSGTKVVGKQDNGSYLLQKGKVLFEVTPRSLAELLPNLNWLGGMPTQPVRLSKINRKSACEADFSGVSFEKFIICDNLYQGYLSTQNDELLDQLGSTLYNADIKFKPYERISIFYWFTALKSMLSAKYSDFFQPIADDNLLGTSAASVEDAMNAQIRALTKGDVTKESEVLALDTHRALTELNAQAREYKELNAKMKS